MRRWIVGDGPTPVIVDEHIPQRRCTGHVGVVVGHDMSLIEHCRWIGAKSSARCERSDVDANAYYVKDYWQDCGDASGPVRRLPEPPSFPTRTGLTYRRRHCGEMRHACMHAQAKRSTSRAAKQQLFTLAFGFRRTAACSYSYLRYLVARPRYMYEPRTAGMLASTITTSAWLALS